MNNTFIYCDGSCRPNPGKGSFCSLIKLHNKNILITYKSNQTTNNIMELLGVIYSLKYIKNNYNIIQNITIWCDSQYVTLGYKEWMPNWIQNNWLTSNNKPVQNLKLWKELYNLTFQKKNIKIKWIKAHTNKIDSVSKLNQFVDKICYSII